MRAQFKIGLTAGFLLLGIVGLYLGDVSQSSLQRQTFGNELTHSYTTPVSQIEDVYPSMFGPTNVKEDMLLSEGPAELLWVTGYSARMVGSDGESPRTQEFMCHNTLGIHSPTEKHGSILGSGYHRTNRLFTLSQGQYEVKFPPGFGIPVSSGERLMLQSQVMNLRNERIGQSVRHLVSTDFIPDSQRRAPLQALSLIDFGIGVEVEDPQAREAPASQPNCAPDAGGNPVHNSDGKAITSHWVVRPGRETRTTALGHPFPFDTTVHYISVHLHSFAQSLALVDLTTGETVFRSRATPTEDGWGLAQVEHYSSENGFEVFTDHEYELRSIYNNTSDAETTAMAFMFCYIKDPYFRVPDPLTLRQRSDEYCGLPPQEP